MVKKCVKLCFYGGCFLMLAWMLYRLACVVPPMPGEAGYELYYPGAACVALLVSAAAVGGIVALDYLDREK